MRKTVVVGGLLTLSLAMGGGAQAQSKCDARVTTALARKVRCKLKTFAAAQEAGGAVKTSRLSDCESTFAGKCGKAQAKGGCQAQASSCPELEATADAAVDVLRGTPTQTASKCDGAVTRAIGKKVGCKLRVHAAAQEAGGAVNPAKLTKCEGNFTAACGKAQSKGDCQAQTSSCAALEATADAAIDVLSGGTTSTTSSSSTTTTTSSTTTTRRARPRHVEHDHDDVEHDHNDVEHDHHDNEHDHDHLDVHDDDVDRNPDSVGLYLRLAGARLHRVRPRQSWAPRSLRARHKHCVQ